MKILVIGGSYFAGRIFSLYTLRERTEEITVLNRGRYPFNNGKIEEIFCDRHDLSKASELLKDRYFDVVVDFCAYKAGDIKGIADALNGRIGKYVYISTASVYEPSPSFIDEQGAIIENPANDDVGEYIRGKILLEEELKSLAIPYLILRPGFIYGPYNYAPRESLLIKKIVQEKRIGVPENTVGKWSFVYVTDVAKAIYSLLDKNIENEVFNLAAPDVVNYPLLIELLVKCAAASETASFKTSEKEDCLQPFPADAVLLYSGTKLSNAVNFTYTPLEKGMELTFKAFEPIYRKR